MPGCPLQAASGNQSYGGLPPGRGRGRQRDGKRIAAQDHEGNQPPDGAFAVGVDPEELGDISDGSSFRLDLPALGGHTGAFRLQGCQDTGFAFALIHEPRTRLALVVCQFHGGSRSALLGCLLNGRIDLASRRSRSATVWAWTLIFASRSAVRSSRREVAAPRSPTWAATSWAYTPAALMTASPKTKATRATRQISAVARHRLASQPAVMSLAASMAIAMAITEFGEPGKRTTIPRIENQAAAPARAIAAV